MDINKKYNDNNLFFKKINEIMIDIQKVFFEINEKIKNIDKIYHNLINDNKDSKEKLSLYGLDTLYFQSKLFKSQYENCDHIYKMLNNRIYGDYFKLYKIIINSCISFNIDDPTFLSFINSNHNIVIYKDLDQKKIYNTKELFNIYELINQLITFLSEYIKSKEIIDIKHKNLIKNGFKINSLAYSYNQKIHLLKSELELYLNYLDFYNHMHLKYFNKLNSDTNDLLNNVNNEIIFDQNDLSNEFTISNLNYQENENNIMNKNIKDILNECNSSEICSSAFIANNSTNSPLSSCIPTEIIFEENIPSVKCKVFIPPCH